MRISVRALGLALLVIPACGAPPQTIPVLAPGVPRTLVEDPNNPATAQGEAYASEDTASATVGVEEKVTPPPIKPIAERTEPSGLKIAILQDGPGTAAAPGQTVDIRYTAWVEGGRIFDSTQQKKALFHFNLGAGDTLKGLDEGVKGMKVGERRRLTVPPALGYGSKGLPSMKVPADATLIYDVDLVGVTNPGDQAPVVTETQPDAAPPVKPIAERTEPDGLKIAILQEGAGAVAEKGQRVSVHYTGWLLDGGKFDTSRDKGQPFPFVLGAEQVIDGWDEGVRGMKVGERRRLTIPPALAYGSREQARIPANSTLVFDIELLKVDTPKPPRTPVSPKAANPPAESDASKAPTQPASAPTAPTP